MATAISKPITDNDSRPTTLTTLNMRSNVPWGDDLGPKDSSIIRLYSINVNGISIDRRGGTFDDICRSIKEVQADIFCGQEHNLDTTQFRIRSALFESAKQHWKRHRISLGTTPITVENSYKPGGTMILTVDSLMGRIVRQDRDPWGRWVVQEFTGKGTRKIAVFSAYQPVDKAISPGTITVAAQHASLLRLTQDQVLNPRTAFRRDLLKALQTYASVGTMLLVVGDFNEVLGLTQMERTIDTTWQSSCFAERLDQDVLTASLAAAAKVKKFGEPAWSVELAEARKQVVVLKKHLSALRTHYDHSSVLAREMAQLSTPVPLPPTPRECSAEIRKVESSIKAIIAESYERRDQERQRKIAVLEATGKQADKESATRLRHMKRPKISSSYFARLVAYGRTN
ncbi:hypothetical protein MHU86_12512 [Fragilaria crotonensis]|nr:hypothetical protein MHU86_12512 [Fragilaria crotonensis]